MECLWVNMMIGSKLCLAENRNSDFGHSFRLYYTKMKLFLGQESEKLDILGFLGFHWVLGFREKLELGYSNSPLDYL